MIQLKVINNVREGKKIIKKEKEMTEDILKKIVIKIRLKT